MITEKAMLAAVHISIWTAVKHDRKVSRDVADQHGAHQGAGRYNKQLLRGADKLEELRTLAGQIRQYFYKITLPWSDEGFRLLPANFYFDLMARMREFEAELRAGSRKLPWRLPTVHRAGEAGVERALPRGRLSLRGKAAEEVRRQARGSAHSVRRRLPRSDVGRRTGTGLARDRCECPRIADTRDRRFVEAGSGSSCAHGRPAQRTGVAVSRFAGHKCLDIVEILPRLNVNGDADLNRFADQIKERLCNYSAQDLKKHDLLRVTTAADAANIVAQMDDLLRGREAAETAVSPTADDIFTRMSAFMEAPAAA